MPRGRDPGCPDNEVLSTRKVDKANKAIVLCNEFGLLNSGGRGHQLGLKPVPAAIAIECGFNEESSMACRLDNENDPDKARVAAVTKKSTLSSPDN